MANQSIIDRYRKEIYRIGWRIQYKAKVTYRREVPIISDSFHDNNFTNQSDMNLYTLQLINSLPSAIEQTIIRELYINDKTETTVARQLNISQQAVSKWKKKALRALYLKVNS